MSFGYLRIVCLRLFVGVFGSIVAELCCVARDWPQSRQRSRYGHAMVTPCTSASPRKRGRDITMLDFFTLCVRYKCSVLYVYNLQYVLMLNMLLVLRIMLACLLKTSYTCHVYNYAIAYLIFRGFQSV